jgi:hypothetical protein
MDTFPVHGYNCAMAQPLRIEDMAPVSVSDDLLNALFAAQEALSETAVMELSHLDRLTADLPRQWGVRLASLKATIVPGQGHHLDSIITGMLKHETAAASRLSSFRKQRAAMRGPTHSSVASALSLVEDSMVKNAEIFRDMRWDLMILRAEMVLPGPPPAARSLADLRRAIRARSARG